MQVESQGVVFQVMATNTGTRPGKDVLIAISATGDLRVRPHRGDYEYYATVEVRRTYLPSPPHPLADMPHITAGALLGSGQGGGHKRDPNGFYCKDGLPADPVNSFSLECAQWRHGAGDKYFTGEIFVNYGDDEVCGALECVIHADNLPDPIRTVLPVRIEVHSASVSVADRARTVDLVNSVGKGS